MYLDDLVKVPEAHGKITYRTKGLDNTMKNTVKKLKELINKNGPDYLTSEPYLTYKELVGSDSTDEITAGAIMLALVRGIDRGITSHNSLEALSKQIRKECCFNKTMADRLSEIFLALYSKNNEDEWKARELEGWMQFVKMNCCFDWNGFAVWKAGSVSVDCHFEAVITLKPAETMKADEKLASAIRDNPFITKGAIAEFYTKKISEYLDYEFEEYCTCDDYFQPVVEDFDIGDRVKYWCKENGFELVSCEGNGYDDGYESSF